MDLIQVCNKLEFIFFGYAHVQNLEASPLRWVLLGIDFKLDIILNHLEMKGNFGLIQEWPQVNCKGFT